MKQLAGYFLLLLSVFAGAFTASRLYDQKSRTLKESFVSKPFEPASFALVNRPFTLIVVGLNNGASLEKTIASIFSQNYENYRVVYIDDASDDGSFELARDLIYERDRLPQVTLVQNETRLGILANVARAVQTCEDHEIVVVLNGEDWLAHEWVLQRLNAYYEDPNLWLTLGQAIDFPTFQLAPPHEIKEGGIRLNPSLLSHLKTFYAALFKEIRESDFAYGGAYLPASAEWAYMIPMLEMGQDHFHFIPEVLCVNNREALYKEDRELQLRCEKQIRSLDPYPPLTTLKVLPCGE